MPKKTNYDPLPVYTIHKKRASSYYLIKTILLSWLFLRKDGKTLYVIRKYL